MGVEDWTKKRKEGFTITLTLAIKKDPTKSIRKHANELEIHDKLWVQQLNKFNA